MSPSRVAGFAIGCLLTTALAPGCGGVSMPWSSTQVQQDPTAEALFNEAMDHFKNKRYARAIDRFQRIKAEFPFSPQLTQAELRLAEAYYLNKQYPEAVAAFKEFQTLHPTNENIPFVLYHLGLAHFDQFTTSDRDQKVTEIAKGYFETVARNHPKSPYAERAREKLGKCEQYLAEHEFKIAQFYFNEKSYAAAKDRFEDLLRRYPNTAVAPRALYLLGEAYRLDKNTAKASLAYEALTHHYPQSPLAPQAQARLKELDGRPSDPLALLLMPDGRQRYVAPPARQGDQGHSADFIAKKDVVYEEPGSEKGFFRRVADTVNPLNWFSGSTEEREETPKDARSAAAKKSSPRSDAAASREVLASVDESLSEKGAAGSAEVPPPPASGAIPKLAAEAEQPKPSDTTAILATIDSQLLKAGKQPERLPPTPEIASVLRTSGASEKASTPEGSKASPPSSLPAAEPATSEFVAGIDAALKRRGIEVPKEVEKARKPASRQATPASGLPASQPPSGRQVELAPRLQEEKGPLFFGAGEFEVKEKADEVTGKPESEKPSEPPSVRASKPSAELPKSVVQSLSQSQAVKPEEKPKPENEEGRGTFDQLKEDLKSVGDLLNPFGW